MGVGMVEGWNNGFLDQGNDGIMGELNIGTGRMTPESGVALH
jgi:hypothetical protein